MTVELGVILSILGAYVGFQQYQINRNRKQEEKVKQEAAVEVKLDHISKGVDEIRIGLKANEQQINALHEKLIRNEESTRSAHRRIDEVMQFIKGGEN